MKKSLFLLSAAALALASCSQEEVLDINTSKVDNNVITFRPRTGKASRSLDITTENLQSFKVLAFKGNIDDDGQEMVQYWPDWVEFSKGAPSTKPDEWGGYFFTSETPYYYPTDGAALYFLAYAPSTLANVTASGYAELRIKDYTVKANIEEQEDIVVGDTAGSYDELAMEDGAPDGATGLELNHTLSKIFVSGAVNTNDQYTYEVVGIKFGNITNKGSLVYNEWRREYAEGDEEGEPSLDGEATTIQWKDLGEQTDSVVYIFDEPITIGNTKTTLMSGEVGDLKGSFMLMPQALQADIVKDDDENWEYNSVRNLNFGPGMSYIAFLVHITHKWTVDGEEKTEDVYPFAEGVERISRKIGDKVYAWAAFPISTEWKGGFYVDYYVDFSKGAGFVAPNDNVKDWFGTELKLDYLPILGKEVKLITTVGGWNNGDEVTETQEEEAIINVATTEDPFPGIDEDDFEDPFGKPKK